MSKNPVFEIVDAKPQHVGQMIRRLRQPTATLMLAMGQNPHRELRGIFNQSSYRRAWLIDGELAGLGGVTGSTLSSEGYIWLTISEAALQYPSHVTREARRQLDLILAERAAIRTKVMLADDAAMRFAAFMGFSVTGREGDVILMEVHRPQKAVVALSQMPAATPAENRQRIFDIEASLLNEIAAGRLIETVQDLPLEHSFIPGAYARQMTIPANTLIVGKIHRSPCFNFVMKGRISVLSEEGVREIVAPASFPSKAGIKRVGFAHEDTVWVTVHATDCTDLEKIEDVLTIPGYDVLDLEEHRKMLMAS